MTDRLQVATRNTLAKGEKAFGKKFKLEVAAALYMTEDEYSNFLASAIPFNATQLETVALIAGRYHQEMMEAVARVKRWDGENWVVPQ